MLVKIALIEVRPYWPIELLQLAQAFSLEVDQWIRLLTIGYRFLEILLVDKAVKERDKVVMEKDKAVIEGDKVVIGGNPPLLPTHTPAETLSPKTIQTVSVIRKRLPVKEYIVKCLFDLLFIFNAWSKDISTEKAKEVRCTAVKAH